MALIPQVLSATFLRLFLIFFQDDFGIFQCYLQFLDLIPCHAVFRIYFFLFSYDLAILRIQILHFRNFLIRQLIKSCFCLLMQLNLFSMFLKIKRIISGAPVFCIDVLSLPVLAALYSALIVNTDSVPFVIDVRHDLVLVEAVREIDDAGESAFLNVDP